MWGGSPSSRALARALALVEGGRSALVELAGEAGIGKTRLLGELSRQAERRGCLVLGAHATEFERDAPYGLWIEALGPHLRRWRQRGCGGWQAIS